MEQEGIDNGIVVSRDLLEDRVIEGRTIRFIPIWMALVMLSSPGHP